MRPQEMGQREACGRRQREEHPQQLQTGSELGAAEPCRSLRKGSLQSTSSQATCQPRVSALKLETKLQGCFPCRTVLFIDNKHLYG